MRGVCGALSTEQQTQIMRSASFAGDVDEVGVSSLILRMTDDATAKAGTSSTLDGMEEAEDDAPIEMLLAEAARAATDPDGSGPPQDQPAAFRHESASRLDAWRIAAEAQAGTEPATVPGILLASARLVIGVTMLYCLAVLLGGGS